MLQFKSVTLSDQKFLGTKLNSLNCNLLNYSFIVQFLYRKVISFEYAVYKNFIIPKIRIQNKDYFLYPVGEGDYIDVFNQVLEYAFSNANKLRFFQFCNLHGAILEEWAETLKGIGYSYIYYPSEDEFEYIYLTESLALLNTHDLKPKRNHIRFFEKNFQWRFENINSNIIPEIKAFSSQWNTEKNIGSTSRLNLENEALNEAFIYFSELNLSGIVLRVDQQIVAFSIGTLLNDDTWLVLFEKADRNVRGAYSMINKLFAQEIATGYQYINRAEDGGVEGLRKAKQSYHPDYMNEVFHLTIYNEK
jgi:uncharacterized protein